MINTYRYDGEMIATWINGRPRGRREQAEPIASFGGGHLVIPLWAGSAFHPGEMAEIVIYNASLDDSQRQRVETYLATKYALHGTPRWQ